MADALGIATLAQDAHSALHLFLAHAQPVDDGLALDWPFVAKDVTHARQQGRLAVVGGLDLRQRFPAWEIYNVVLASPRKRGRPTGHRLYVL